MDDAQLHDLQERTPELATLCAEGAAAIAAAADGDALEQVRVHVLGRKSRLTEILRSISSLPPEQRPVVGKLGNIVRVELERQVEEREGALSSASLKQALAAERLDVTLPGVPLPLGHQHLITRTIREVEDIFLGMGYQVAEGPEIEFEYYNFTALNTPDDHPARSVDDTFFIDTRTLAGRPAGGASGGDPTGDGGDASGAGRAAAIGDLLLRTHTSPVQVRTLERGRRPSTSSRPAASTAPTNSTPPTRRSSTRSRVWPSTAASRWPICRARWTSSRGAEFGAVARTRIRPHFFPFTEPSVELDVQCLLCGGAGCRSCKYSGWLEILGAGMVDPNLYGFVGYDPGELQGFAFGMGVERMAMLKHGVPDARAFFDNDLRFLEQF